jgi:hypothetical protein
MMEILADLPDLWDVNIADYSIAMGDSRFVNEGALEDYIIGFCGSGWTYIAGDGRWRNGCRTQSWKHA